MAARVAAQLKNEPDVRVEIVQGGLGEFTITIDGQKAVATHRLWYPNPASVVKKVRALLAPSR
jgi:hypothetical protein